MPLQRKNLQIGDLVKIEWIDAQGSEEWSPLEEIKRETAPLIKTVGFITCLGRNSISVSQSIDVQNEMASHTLLIPAGMVVSIKKI